MASETRRVTFRSAANGVAGDLHLPNGHDGGVPRAAVVIVTPGSSVKEQIGAEYGRRLAEHNFVALAFDPSHQGESGGSPRDLESPATRIEDVRSAIDHLTTLPSVDADRIGILGICAGGGYAVSAAMTDHRAKAIGTVVAVNIGRAYRQADPKPGAIRETLEAVGAQRTAEARGGGQRRDPWIPDTPEDAKAAGITDRDVLDAIDYYRTPRGMNPQSTNRLYFPSTAQLLAYDAFHLVETLLTQPLQVIVAGRLGTTFSHEDGRTLFERAPNARDLMVVEGAGHYDMYDRPEYVDPAVARLAAFYHEHLGSGST